MKSLVYWIGVWEKKGKELGYNTKIDGIGSQMHISYYENPQTLESKKKGIQNMLKIMAETGKLVRISELDMGYVDADGKDVTTAQLEKLPIEERVAKERLWLNTTSGLLSSISLSFLSVSSMASASGVSPIHQQTAVGAVDSLLVSGT